MKVCSFVLLFSAALAATLLSERSLALSPDGIALLEVKNSLNDSKNFLRNWNDSDDSPCKWIGISCGTQDSRVISINLPYMQFEGIIAPTIGKLNRLQRLALLYFIGYSGAAHGICYPVLIEQESLDLARRNTYESGKNTEIDFVASLQLKDMKAKNFRKRSLEVEDEDPDHEKRLALALEEVKYLQKQREKKSGIPALPIPATSVAASGVASNSSAGGLVQKEGDGEKDDLVLQDTFAQETAVMEENPNMYLGANYFKEAYPQILDLSSNILRGAIPSSLGRLTRLKYLNLSTIFLSGEIPEVGVLSKFGNSSFTGNLDLCGRQAGKPCRTSLGFPAVLPHAASDEAVECWDFALLLECWKFGFSQLLQEHLVTWLQVCSTC